MEEEKPDLIKMYAIFAKETLRKMKNEDGSFCEGKLAAQAGHAYLHAWWDGLDRSHPDYASEADAIQDEYYYSDVMCTYRYGDDARKIALVVETVQDLEHLYETYRPYMGATIVEDCGYTIFAEPTITAVGLGPVRDSFLKDSLLKSLSSLRKVKF